MPVSETFPVLWNTLRWVLCVSHKPRTQIRRALGGARGFHHMHWLRQTSSQHTATLPRRAHNTPHIMYATLHALNISYYDGQNAGLCNTAMGGGVAVPLVYVYVTIHELQLTV